MLTGEEELFCICWGKHGIKMFCCRVPLKELPLASPATARMWVMRTPVGMFSAWLQQHKTNVTWKGTIFNENQQLLPSSLACRKCTNKTNWAYSYFPLLKNKSVFWIHNAVCFPSNLPKEYSHCIFAPIQSATLSGAVVYWCTLMQKLHKTLTVLVLWCWVETFSGFLLIPLSHYTQKNHCHWLKSN